MPGAGRSAALRRRLAAEARWAAQRVSEAYVWRTVIHRLHAYRAPDQHEVLMGDGPYKISCGADCWGHLPAIIDCHYCEIVGNEYGLRSSVREAERAVQEACLARF